MLLIFSGGLKIFEKIEGMKRKHVIMNVINPPVFYTYSQNDVLNISHRNELKIEEVINKHTHVLPYLLPFDANISNKASRLILKIDIFKFLSFGNYYILKKEMQNE